jgi:hypothetical protein
MIFIFDPHFMRTSPLWLVSSQTLAFAYLPAARKVTSLASGFFTLPAIGAISAASREMD